MKRFIYFLLFSIACFYSCKKDTQLNDDCRVVSIRAIFNSSSFNNGTVGYDENGNLSKMTFSSDTGAANFEVKYLKDSIIFKTKKLGNHIYVLDAKSRIIKANPGYFQKFTFTYDVNGFIETATESTNEKLNFFYENGNLIRIIKESIFQTIDRKTTYSFSYDLDEKAVDLVNDSNPLSYFFPKPPMLPSASFFGNTSKNRLKTVQVVQESPAYNYRAVFTYDLSYKKDSNEKIVSLNVDESVNSTPDFNTVYNFTYECK